ncbi:MAG TPA: PEP-CTERM sorting domain-containing protein [Methylomirabilota bacterium]|jgi:hypothetical protein
MTSTGLRQWAGTLLLFVTLVTGALVAPAQAASILGDTITVDWHFPSLGSIIFSQAVVVPGAVVPGSGLGSVTIGTGTITVENTTFGWSGSSGFNGLIFTDTTQVPNFTSFSLVSIDGFAPPVDPILSFTANQLVVNFNANASSNVADGTGQLYTFSFTTEGGPVTVVPEPATLLLLGSTLTAFGLAGRKVRRKRP